MPTTQLRIVKFGHILIPQKWERTHKIKGHWIKSHLPTKTIYNSGKLKISKTRNTRLKDLVDNFIHKKLAQIEPHVGMPAGLPPALARINNFRPAPMPNPFVPASRDHGNLKYKTDAERRDVINRQKREWYYRNKKN